MCPLKRVKPSALLTSLLSSWESYAGAFIAVLRWSNRVWHDDPTWHGLPASARVACVWAHAGRTLSLLLVRPSSAQTICERFNALHPRDLRQLLPFDHEYEADIATPKRVAAPVLLVKGLSTAMGEDREALLEAHIPQILEHVSHSNEQGSIPSATFFEDRRFGRNALASFLAQPVSPLLAERLELGGMRLLAAEAKDEIRVQMLSQLEQNPAAPESWGLLHYVGYEWLPADEASRVNQVANSLKLPEGKTDEAATLICHVLADIVPYCDAELHSALQGRLIEWARRLRSLHLVPVVDIHADTEGGKDGGLLIELAVALARRATLKATLEALASVASALVTAWPALAPTLRALLGRALREVPSADGEVLWAAFVKLRAIP
jgi:hypothetical protein